MNRAETFWEAKVAGRDNRVTFGKATNGLRKPSSTLEADPEIHKQLLIIINVFLKTNYERRNQSQWFQ